MFPFDSTRPENLHSQDIILHFKTRPCPSLIELSQSSLSAPFRPCPQLPCLFYHTPEDRRRPVYNEETQTYLYQAVMCQDLINDGFCIRGDFCKCCHTQVELNYHPMYYKSKPCMVCNFENNPSLCPNYHLDESSKKISSERPKNKKGKEQTQPRSEDLYTQSQIFDLDSFKTKQCHKKEGHNPKFCALYHHDKDRRRNTSIFHYGSEICPLIAKGMECPDGDSCKLCHNKVEQLYHPERYKRKFCTKHPRDIQKCEYGNFCSFAHDEKEIKIELLHNLKQDESFYLFKYKTVFCPYIYDHDRSQCMYAHNAQDYRRNPRQYRYEPVQCPYWSQGQILSYEEGGCSKQMDCDKCHGWKELEYHSAYYKTKSCSNGSKCIKKDCPFFHNNSDKRQATKPLSQLNTFANSFQPGTFTTPTKPVPKSDPDDRFSAEPLSSSLGKKFDKSSNYQRPVIPVHIPFSLDNEMIRLSEMKKPVMEQSTRPNSNVSSCNYSEDDAEKQLPVFATLRYSEGSVPGKKNIKKRNSVEHKNHEKVTSPLSAGSEKISRKPLFSKLTTSNNIWAPFPNKLEEKSEDFMNWERFKEKENILQRNDSNESLHSCSNDKFSLISEKQTAITETPSVKEDQFRGSLLKKLEARDLGHTIQFLLNPNIDFDTLKSFGYKDFAKFPQICEQDKEKIVKIIQDVLDEEILMAEINTVNGDHNSVENNVEDYVGSFDSNFDFLWNKKDLGIMSGH